jgi:hypothetical protein
MTIGGHGGMACMAQDYHGYGDVDGLLHKIVSVIHFDEQKAYYAGRKWRA